MKQKITAVLVERLFIVSFALLTTLMAYNFYFVQNIIKTKVRDADHAEIDADVSRKNTSQTNAASEWLAHNKSIVKKTKKVVGDATLYQYQNQIVYDLESYATQSNIKVISYSFTGAKQNPTAPTPTTQPLPPAPGKSVAPAQPINSKLKLPKGVSATYADITLESQVSYIGLLQFISLIEQNVTRMQITNITLAPDLAKKGFLSSPSMTILVFTK